jgi:hypothetical protein
MEKERVPPGVTGGGGGGGEGGAGEGVGRDRRVIGGEEEEDAGSDDSLVNCADIAKTIVAKSMSAVRPSRCLIYMCTCVCV